MNVQMVQVGSSTAGPLWAGDAEVRIEASILGRRLSRGQSIVAGRGLAVRKIGEG